MSLSFPKPWQESLRDAVTSITELQMMLELPSNDAGLQTDAFQDFPLRVPREFVARMEKGNPHDPLLLQVLPQQTELQYFPGYCHDPLHEAQVNPVPGILHKYQGRVLVTLAGACAIHCRYCFRRHFPYAENTPGQKGWESILTYIAKDPSIHEVILSGGDPLMMKDDILSKFVAQLNNITHLKRLRLHTRLPIVIPARVTSAMIDWILGTRLKPIIVLHCNHANEIDDAVILACRLLRQHGILVLNQTVLLKNINDNAQTLIQLSEKLFEADVLPYYLHLLDAVHGAAHFDVPIEKAKTIVAEMMRNLPGYLIPKLVKEMPGVPSKVGIAVELQ